MVPHRSGGLSLADGGLVFRWTRSVGNYKKHNKPITKRARRFGAITIMVNKARIFRSTAPALFHLCNRSARAVTQQTSEPVIQINFSMFVSLDSNRSNESPLIASVAMSTTIRAGVLSLSRSRIKLDFVDKVNRLTSTNSKFLPSPAVCAL